MTIIDRRALLTGASALSLGLAACSSSDGPRFLTYTGPDVTQIVVNKAARNMHLLHQGRALRSYDIELGFSPQGPKRIEGDGKTPEGVYTINRRNPQSRFHLSIGVSYPDVNDYAKARAMGAAPGGEIFIHGTPRRFHNVRDWTAGCIAVTNTEIEEIYSMVRDGTLIHLQA